MGYIIIYPFFAQVIHFVGWGWLHFFVLIVTKGSAREGAKVGWGISGIVRDITRVSMMVGIM